MKRIASTSLAVSSLLLALAACGGEHDDGHDHEIPDSYDCTQETRADTYVANLEKTGDKGLTFVLVESTPAPPRKGNNDWILSVKDDQGNPVDNLTIDVMPWMPDHNHGAMTAPEVTPMNGMAGSYLMAPINMWMPGLWEVRISVTDGAGLTDDVVYSICIEG